jgi:hypothetical protein
MTTKTITLDFEWSYEGGNTSKIAAIKMARMAFGIGLKEAKDLVEGGSRRLRLTPAQHGMLDALLNGRDSLYCGIEIEDVRIEEASPDLLNLTMHEPL